MADRRRTRQGGKGSWIALILGLFVVFSLVIVVARKSTRDAQPEASTTTVPSATTTETVATSPPTATASVVVPNALGARAATSGDAAANDETEAARLLRERNELVYKNIESSLEYAPGSATLAGKTDLMHPNHIDPWVLPLVQYPDGGMGKVAISQWQDRSFISDGEEAVATFSAMLQSGGTPPVIITKSVIAPTDPTTEMPLDPIGTVTFHDDGVAPDAAAGDGTYSAFVPPTAGMFGGKATSFLVTLDLQIASETGTINFRFATTGSVPAKFTGVAHDAIEQGSLAFHVGVEVYRAGNYEAMGRVFDATGQPVAFLTANVPLTLDAHEIVLTAYGKLLRDQNGKPPFTLKEVEGYRFLAGQYPDREMMIEWPGPYESAAFDVNLLTNEPYDSPAKTAKLASLASALAGPSDIAPVDSNGIPIPPVPLPVPSAAASH